MLSPASQSTLGLSVDLTASAKTDTAAIRQIDFIGHYEDVNYEGDGVYASGTVTSFTARSPTISVRRRSQKAR